MSYTLYDASVAPAIEATKSLKAILKKAEEHNSSINFSARLNEDMLPLSFQVYVLNDLLVKLAARATGTEPVALEKDIESFAAAYAQIDRAAEILSKVERETINGRADSIVSIGMGPGVNKDMKVRDYLDGYSMPNIYFHLSMAYAILRKEGVPLGKMDYLTPFIGKFVN